MSQTTQNYRYPLLWFANEIAKNLQNPYKTK